MRALRDFLLAPPDGPALDRGARRERGLLAVGDRRDVDARSPEATATGAAPVAVALLCAAAEDARALGVAAATLLARRARAGCGVACIWSAPEPYRHAEPQPPANRGARRLSAALAGRGLDARPCGRAVAVALPADPPQAVAAACRAAAAAGAAPAVLALGGPRDAAFDGLLAEKDRLLVITRPGANATVGALALAGLPPAASSVHAVALGRAGRALAAAGLAVPPGLRRALDPPSGERG
jgi:hypothetical protein